MIDRGGLAQFLRRRRESLHPADVGLPAGVRRRTPGLRREEVALLAGISTDYYGRLEQQRPGPQPSAQVVAGLARALRCDPDERDHLFHLADLTPPRRRAERSVRPSLIALAQQFTDVPASIRTDLHEVLWQNAVADSVWGTLDPDGGRADNLIWRWFCDVGSRRSPEADWPRISAVIAGDLRAASARRGADAEVTALIRDLSAASPEFRTLWNRHDVGVRREDEKRMHHPVVGLLQLTCTVLHTDEDDLKLVVFYPTPGTDARAKLDLLNARSGTDTRDLAVHASGGAADPAVHEVRGRQD